MNRARLLVSVLLAFAAPLAAQQYDAASVSKIMSDAKRASDLGKPDEALALYQKIENSKPTDPNLLIDLWYRKGRALAQETRGDDALKAYDQSLAAADQAKPVIRARAQPVAISAKGEALRAMGKAQAARDQFSQAYQLYAQLRNLDGMARMQAELGSTEIDLSNYEEALKHYQQADTLMEKIGSPDRADLLINTSSLYTWLGKYDGALEIQRRAGPACATSVDKSCAALLAHAQSFTHFQMRDYAAAAKDASLAASLYGPDQPIQRARALNNAGLAYIYQHDPKKGLETLKVASDLVMKYGDYKDKATVVDSIGTAYRELKEFKLAFESYGQSLSLWHVSGNKEGERDTLGNLGTLSIASDNPNAAVLFYKLAVNLAQSLRKDARGLDPELSQSLTWRLEPTYQQLIDLLVSLGRIPEAEQAVHMLKEQEYYDFLSRGGPPGNTTATLTANETNQQEALQDHLFAAAIELEALNAKPVASLTPDEVKQREALEAQVNESQGNLEAFVGQINKDLSAEQHATPAIAMDQLEGIQSTLGRLGHGAVLLQYIELNDHLRILFTASQGGAYRGYSVNISSQDLNHAIADFRQQISARDPAEMATAQKLYNWLMPRDLQKDLSDARAQTLMISLDSSLRYLPMAALHDGQKWLVERFPIVLYTLAGTSRLEHAPNAQWSVSAFGLTHAVSGYPALPYVRDELKSIVGPGGLSGTALYDGDFTEAKLHDAVFVTRPPVLHIASHFVFHPGTEDNSVLILGDGNDLSLATLKKWTFNSLDLLTLSACETAVGGGFDANGREIEGLGVLAQSKGADAVLATLWPVADLSTAAFMNAFYAAHGRTATGTKAEAMRAAQLAMIRGQITAANAASSVGVSDAAGRGELVGASSPVPVDYKQPYFWAPFVLIGNWR